MDQIRSQQHIRPDRWAYLWLALGTLLLVISTGRWTFGPAAWLASVFYLRFTRGKRVWVGFAWVVATSFVAVAVAWYGLQPMPLPAYLASMLLSAAIGSLPYLADRVLVPRLTLADGRPRFAGTLIFATAATAIEFLMMTTSPLGSFGAVAYSQYGSLVLLQLASVGGLWGIAFLMNWLAPVVNWAWEEQFVWRRIARGATLFGAVLGLVAIFGAYRLWAAPPTGRTVAVAGFTATAEDSIVRLMALRGRDPAGFRRESLVLHQQYLDRTRSEARRGARIVLWPEGAGLGEVADVDALVAEGQRLAQAEGIYLAMPVFKLFDDPARKAENRLLVADPNGVIVLDHLKFGGNAIEGSLAGDRTLRTVETPYGTLSGAICWDTDFPAVIAQAGRNGTDILLSPAHDWQALDPLHGQMSAFRAIENGITVVRLADQGWSVVTDPYGRSLASMDHFATDDRVLRAEVPIEGTSALYPRLGDAVGWLSVLGFVAMALWALIAGRRNLPAVDGEPFSATFHGERRAG